MTPPWLAEGQQRFIDVLPEHVERMGWSADRLALHQTAALRAVLGAALELSPYHRGRLAGLDPDSFGLDDLRCLPVMTKADLMDHFDDVCTDRRITRAGVEAHLAGLGGEPEVFEGEFVAFGSGGSSGRRGVFVRHYGQLADYLATVLRSGLAGVVSVFGWPPPFRIAVTMVTAPTAVHATRATAAFVRGVADVTFVPVTLPFDEIVERVQASAPMLLVGYPSMLARLADRAAAGGLSIAPQSLVVTAEHLTADLRTQIEAGFGQAPANSFGSSEGLVGASAPGEREFTFASDAAIVEFVDAHDRPVPVGTCAHHVLVTNLANVTQPLIRYRLDDAMTPLPALDGHGHQRALVDGRFDDALHLGDVEVHPLVVRTALLRFPEVSEFQVRYAEDFVVVDLVVTRAVPLAAVEDAVARALAAAGALVAVAARIVESVRRDAKTGKAPRVMRSPRRELVV